MVFELPKELCQSGVGVCLDGSHTLDVIAAVLAFQLDQCRATPEESCACACPVANGSGPT